MIERTRFPSPSLEDLINTLQESKVSCKLDMNNTFLQFDSDSASREITTFITNEGLHRFKRLNFETKAAHQNITKENDKTLGNLPNCIVIADDVISFTTSFDTIYDTLDKVLNRFLENCIILNK